MPLETYITKTFATKAQAIIGQANVIIAEYQKQGFTLSLRQLYYQFVSRDLLPNEVKYYRLLGNCVNDGRLAGEIDWLAIEDRDRNVVSNSHWGDPAEIMRGAAHSYAIDKWADQPYHVEVWIEKKALEGVIDPVCSELDVPYFACKGYTSQSEQWRAGRRFRAALRRGQQVVVFHLGDHDPSGIDMTRDNQERLTMFAGTVGVDDDLRFVDLKRLALNMDQVEEFNPPPNPAKLTDSRAEDYIARFGDSSWELDALEPSMIAELIRSNVLALRDEAAWAVSVKQEDEGRRLLKAVANDWEEITGDL